MKPIETEKSSQALVFCSKIMFEVVPESRKVRRGNEEKVWKFIFNKKNEKHVVHIVTYKRENTVPKNEDKSMILTVEQAGLIALETFERLIKVAYTNGHKLMTPSAGAYFSKDDLPALAKELNISEVDLLIKISQSTQRDGHYLEFSDIDIAICASIAATRNMKEGSLKKNIVEKKLYLNKGHVPDKKRIAIIAKYVTGGVPTESSYEELVKVLDTKQSIVP